jgi:hypothetical protein
MGRRLGTLLDLTSFFGMSHDNPWSNTEYIPEPRPTKGSLGVASIRQPLPKTICSGDTSAS